VVDACDRVRVPPESPVYSLRRVWLPEEIEAGYYYGLANEGLWPLCHNAFHRPLFNEKNWECYRRANELFAEAVLQEAAGEPAFVFVQDYHLALLPRMLKDRNPNLIIAQFWHIPWPNREAFRVFPWREELLDGMLGNDLLGFHLPYHCSNFLDTADCQIEALIDQEHGTVRRRGHVTKVKAFPISIDFDAHSATAAHPAVDLRRLGWYGELGRIREFLGIGIDRIDYTKGIPERLVGIDQFLTEHAEFAGRFVFLQVGVPSRIMVPAYRDLIASIRSQIEAINLKWETRDWKPIVFIDRHVDQPSLMALHKMADFCMVTSLHDGMNLVAKEFVASRVDEDGCLILSSFTGAARELREAILVNPYAPDEIAGAIYTALTMHATERQHRMRRMREVVSTQNVYRWAGKIVEALSDLHASSSWGRRPVEQVAFAEVG
jgi:trehalose 6-phosphate synthase